ncbi:uncharacterized protein [Halyomorpha halys]|uniref:uncharacterized protein n=1 Tax=Halyomorpha halys TaxID=286706 RepID=UPI0006D4E5EE|nr:uncharacterized protein LOC106688288 [Halyomorpha halys]
MYPSSCSSCSSGSEAESEPIFITMHGTVCEVVVFEPLPIMNHPEYQLVGGYRIARRRMPKHKFRKCMRDLMRIFLYIHDDEGNRFKFFIRVDKPLKFVMNCYCSIVGHMRREIRFLYNGRRIYGFQTPFHLGIGYKDSIEAYELMTGGEDRPAV